MALYGNGEPWTQEEAEKRLNIWLKRLEKGEPHAAFIVYNKERHPIGLFVAGAAGNRFPGASEVMGIGLPEYHRKGYATKCLNSIVKAWAPYVRTKGLDKDSQISDKFKVFANEALKRLDATSSPLNIASLKLLDGAGFKNANTDLSSNEDSSEAVKLDLSKDPSLSLKEVNQKILDLYGSENPLEESKRYLMIDQNGIKRTFSNQPKFKNIPIRFHFELDLDDVVSHNLSNEALNQDQEVSSD